MGDLGSLRIQPGLKLGNDLGGLTEAFWVVCQGFSHAGSASDIQGLLLQCVKFRTPLFWSLNSSSDEMLKPVTRQKLQTCTPAPPTLCQAGRYCPEKAQGCGAQLTR